MIDLVKKKYKLSFLSELSIYVAVIIIILSIGPWFIWNHKYLRAFFFLFFIILRIIIVLKQKSLPADSIHIMPITFLFLWYFWYNIYSAVNIIDPFSSLITQMLPLFFVIIMDLSEKLALKELAIKIFAIILAVSLFFYLLLFIGIPLPYEILEHPTNRFYGSFANFYFFILGLNFYSADFWRFSSVFTEPGHLVMICALYLYINNYEIKKWYNMIMLVSLLVSFSFAGYVLLVLGWLIFLWAAKGKLITTIPILVFVIVCSVCLEVFTSTKYSSGIVSTFILDRAEYDKEKGVAGNNRNDQAFENYYNNFSNTEEYFFGAGREEYKILFDSTPNSSYRVSIVNYGIIGVGIFVFMFLSFVLFRPSRMAFGMFVLFTLSFLQRPYWNWPAQSFMFVVSVFIFYCNKLQFGNKSAKGMLIM